MKGLVPCWHVHDVMGFSVTMFVERVVSAMSSDATFWYIPTEMPTINWGKGVVLLKYTILRSMSLSCHTLHVTSAHPHHVWMSLFRHNIYTRHSLGTHTLAPFISHHSDWSLPQNYTLSLVIELITTHVYALTAAQEHDGSLTTLTGLGVPTWVGMLTHWQVKQQKRTLYSCLAC